MMPHLRGKQEDVCLTFPVSDQDNPLAPQPPLWNLQLDPPPSMPAHTVSENQTLSAPDQELWIQTIPPIPTTPILIHTDLFQEPRLWLRPTIPAPVMPVTTAEAMLLEVRTIDLLVHGINLQGLPSLPLHHLSQDSKLHFHHSNQDTFKIMSHLKFHSIMYDTLFYHS